MKSAGLLSAVSLALSMAFTAQAAHADSYPDKQVRLVVAASAGGPTDVVARLLAQKLTESLGQPFVVENKPGAAQTLGTRHVAQASPDGYTLLLGNSSALVLQPFTMENLPYDVKTDFTIVSHVGLTPLVMYTHEGMPATSLDDMRKLVGAKPGALSYGSWGPGSGGHLLTEYFSRQADLQMIHVPYASIAPSINALVGKQLDFAVAEIGTGKPFLQSGRLKALAVTGQARSSALPDVPTFGEQGIKGMESFSSWWAILAPKGTPQPVVDKLELQIEEIAKSPEFSNQLRTLGVDATGWRSAQTTQFVDGELTRWKGIIEALPNVSFK